MAFYKTPEEMYKTRAERYKKEGDLHWRKGKSGEGGWHFSKAREKYEEAKKNNQRAQDSKGKTWKTIRGGII